MWRAAIIKIAGTATFIGEATKKVMKKLKWKNRWR
jgi:hypothetical protein